jgi:lipopolysaccharide/colanic/teichoic acid biosynthesis glycosyltransferase
MPSPPIVTTHTNAKADLLPPSAVLVPPPHPARTGRSQARVNLRSHSLRGALRVLVLAAVDIMGFALLWVALRLIRDEGVAGSALQTLVTALFPAGLLGGVRFLLALGVGLLASGTYSPGDNRRDANRLYAGAALAAFAALYSTAWSQGLGLLALRMALLSLAFGSVLALGRMLVDRFVRTFKPLFYVRRAVVVRGLDAEGRPLQEVPGNLDPFSIVAEIDARTDGTVSKDVEAHIDRERADSVVVVGDLPSEVFVRLGDVVLAHGCRLLVSPSAAAAGIEQRTIWLEGHPFVEMSAPALRGFQLWVKRLIDLLGSVIILVLLLPLMAVVALWIRLDSRGGVLFSQERLGQGGRTFRCLKFRTMRPGAEALLRDDPDLFRMYVENDFKLPPDQDPRVTAPGRFLRRTSLDELPHLFNVLRGEMSLVGPRPIVPAEIMHYEGMATLLLSVKPGMTGKWAVDGRSDVAYPDRALLELDYVRSWSLWSDILTLVKTPFVVLAGRGAH